MLPCPAPQRPYLDDYGQPSALGLVHIHGLSPDPQVVGVQSRVLPESVFTHDASGGPRTKSWRLSKPLACGWDAGPGSFMAEWRGRPPVAGREQDGAQRRVGRVPFMQDGPHAGRRGVTHGIQSCVCAQA